MSDQNPPSSNSTGFDFSNIDFGKQDPNKGIEFDFSNIEFGGQDVKKKDQKEVSESPIPTGTSDFTDFDVQAFKDGIFEMESLSDDIPDPYLAQNSKSSALGKYQHLWGQHGKSIQEYTGLNKEEYLKNPQAQEDFMDYWVETSLKPEAKRLREARPEASKEYSNQELMALVHFQGLKNAKNFLDTGKTAAADRNVPVKQYLKTFNKGYTDSSGLKGFDFSDVDFSEEQKDDTPFPFRTNPDDPENFDKTGKRPGYQEPTKPLYAFTEERYREQDEASKLTKERRKEKDKPTPEEEERKAKFEETVDLIEFKYGDRVFEDGIVDSVLDDYAPKDQEGYVLSREEGEQIQVMERNPELEDRANLALNEVKKNKIAKRFSPVLEDVESQIDDMMTSSLDRVSKKIKSSQEDYLEEIDRRAQPGTALEFGTTGPGPLPLFPDSYQRFLDNPPEDLSDALTAPEMSIALSNSVDKILDEQGMQLGEQRTMAKSYIINEYGKRKFGEKVLKEVVQDYPDMDGLEKEAKGLVEELDKYNDEAVVKAISPYATEYQKRVNELQQKFDIKAENIAKNIQVQKPEEYNNLVSKYQGKVDSGELSQEEAQSAFNQEFNIMLVNSPELVEIRSEADNVHSMYETSAARIQREMYEDYLSSNKRLKEIGVKNEAYANAIGTAAKDILTKRKDLLDQEWASMVFMDKASRGLTTGVGQTISALGYIVGDNQVGNNLVDVSNQITIDNPMIDVGEFSSSQLTNPDWWATRVLPSAPLTMSMMVPGIGVGSAAVGGLTKVGLSRVAAGLLGGSITGVGMRAFEGSVEAALDYNENIKKGESVEYSSQRAAKIKAKNMNLALLDAAEFATLFLPTTSYLGAFLKFGSQIPMNAVEELYQEGLILEDKAYRDYLKGVANESPEVKYEEVFSGGGVSDIINFAKTPMGKEVGAIGGIYGAAFGAVSLKSDISRARSRRVLNQYISDQLPGISKTENTFNEEMKPLSFGYGAYQRNEFETEKEFVNRRKWQMKATLTEMQNKGQISSEDFASGNEHIDFVFEKISDLPSNLSSEQRLQLLDKLTEIQEAERNMRDVSDDTILAAKKKRIAGLRKEAEQIVNNEAQGYFVDGASLSNKEFKTLLNSPTFLYELARGEHKILINNDAEMEAALGAVNEMVSESDTKEALLAVVESGLAKMSEETTPEGAITWAQAIGEEEIKPVVDEATPAVTPEVTIIEEKIDPVMERVDNEEDININEINEAINILFDEIEKIEKSDLDVNQKRTQMRELLIAADKLDKYENVTETKDVTVTKRTATRVPAEVEGEQTKSPQERIEGRKVRRIEGDEFFADVEVTEDTQKGKTKRPTRGTREEVTVIERDTDGNLILQNYDTKGEKTTAQKLNATSMNDFELVETIKDENDTVIGAVLRNKNDDGQVFAIDDAEIAMDLAIEVTQAELGTVTTEEFEEVIGQVEVKITKGDKKAAPAEPTKPAPKPAPKSKPATVESLDELGDKINLSTESKEEKNRKYTVVADAQKVLKAIAEILPNVDIVVHETQEEFEAATGSKEEGIFIGKKEFKGVKGTIHINLAKAKAGETVYHEVFHPLILNAVKTSTEANALTTRMVEGVMRASKGNAKVVNALSDWLEAYQGVDRSEEAIAELGAIIGKEYSKLTRSAQNIIKRFINRLANMFGMGDVFRAVNKDADIVAMMNSLVTSLRTGEVITVEDIAGSILEGKIGEPGSIIDSGIKERIEGMNKLKDTSFNTGVEYKNPLNMPSPRTIEDVLESSGGASLFINSDGTGAFLSKDGKKLEGGWRYTYFPLNQEELIGFAATSTIHINTLYNKAQLLTKYRDSKFPNESGKPLSVFVTIQNAETMLGEWYAGDFLMDGINEVINQEKIEGGFEAIKELLINAAEGLVVKKDGELKRIKGVDKFIELVKSDKFNTEEGRNFISTALRSKSYSFKFRVELLKSLIPKSSIAGKNKEIKRALKDAGYGRKEFYRLYTDEVLLEKLEATNFDEKSIGGVTLGGYFMDPLVSKEDFFNNRENGIDHDMFNESFSSNGETFVLDGAYHVNDIFPEMSYPSSKGYEAYNEANGTNYTKESAKDDIGVQFEVAKFLLEQKDSFSKNLLIPPFTSIAGSIYTAASEALESDEVVSKERKAKASPEKFVSELEKTKASDPTQYWSVDSVSLSAAKKGKVISVDGGYGFVSNDGDIKGVFKLPTSKVKGVADKILQESVKQGGTKLDNFDGYLTKIYERNGFRIAARIPFNEEFSPDGWNKEKHGTPDVVAMVYDPNNELGIKEKKFNDYDAGIAYRDSFLEEKTSAPKRGKGKIQWTETQSWEDMGMKPSDAVISTRNEAVRQAFVDLVDGKKTLAEARAVRDQLTPVRPIEEFFAATSLDRINEGLSGSKPLKINKEIELEDGTMVDVRLDIPAYKDHNAWVVTIHKYSGAAKAGETISYTNAVMLKAPKGGKITFATKPAFALSIATRGASKNTIARIQGEISHFRDKDGNIIEDVDERGRFAEEYFEKNIYENPEWVQIGMNPFKRSDFWDRNNPEKTVVGADEVFQIGGLVYAKNPVYSESQGYDVMFTGITYNKIPLTEAQEKEIAKKNPDLVERFDKTKGFKKDGPKYRSLPQDDMDSIRINFPDIYEKIRTEYGIFIADAAKQESQTLRDKEGTVIKFRKPRGPLAEALSRASDKVQRASKMTNTQRLKSVEKDLLDFRAQTKRILASHENLSDVSSRFINVLGSPGAAQLMFSEYYEKIYQDLTPTDREFLDVIIAARRIVSINQKRADDNRASVKKLKSDIPQSFFDKGNLGIDAWESVMDDVSSMLATKPFAIDEILDAANTSLESQDVLYTDKITSTQQRKLAKDLKTALKDVLKEENYTGRDAKGKPVGLASARAQMYEIEDQLGAKKFNKLTQRADEYFFAFMELLDDDLKAGLISKEQYDAMAGIEYSPRVFLTYLFNLNDELIKRDPYEVDFQLKTNYSLSGPVIRTLKNGIKDNKASENIFYEFVGDSQLVFSNYLATRQKLRMYNDLNQRASEELSGLQKRQVELKNKSKLNTEEQNELDVINDVFDNFSLTQKRGFVPNRYMVDGKENFFYIREDVNEQWNNIRPNFGNFASESTVGKVAMWALTTPVSALRTFATGTLAPLFGIGNAAVDAAQVLNFSLAEGYSEFMPARTVQFLKDLGIVPGMPMETATKSVRTQDALFREAVMEGVMMDYLHTRGREGEPVITQMLDWMAGQVDDVAIVDPAFKGSRKALRKMFDASLYINKQSELAPRMAIYKRVRDHYYAEIKKQNLTSKDQEKARKDARQTAAMYARELMNFAEGGRLTKAANPFMAYLNARFLGFTTPLYGALSSPKNFAKIFSRTMQFSAMSLGATVGLAYWLVSMFMDDEDEKEGKKPIDIIRETREQASPYIRQKYYLIPMGLKDEEGNYKSIRIKKNPSLVPALEMGEMYIDNLLEGKSAKDALPELNLQYAAKINHAVFDNFLPMNVSFWDEKGNTRGLEMASEILNGNPLMSGTVEMVTGYDLYRNRPIKKKYFNEMNISEAYLGYADDRVQPFYKSISMLMKKKGVMDVSPYNIQHFSQKMITTPENNPYVYTAYSMLNKASGTDAYEAKDKTFMENIMKGVSKKLIYSSRYRPGIENKNFSELNNELQNNLDKDYLIKQELNKVADKAAKEGGFGLLLSKEENVEKVLKAKDEFFNKLEGYGFEVNDKDRDIYISELAEKVINNYAGVEESNNRKLKDIIYLGVGERKDRNMALAFWMAYPQLDYDSKKPITKQSEEFLETISNLSETYAQVKGQKKPKLPDSFYLELISVYKEYEMGKDTKGK